MKVNGTKLLLSVTTAILIVGLSVGADESYGQRGYRNIFSSNQNSLDSLASELALKAGTNVTVLEVDPVTLEVSQAVNANASGTSSWIVGLTPEATIGRYVGGYGYRAALSGFIGTGTHQVLMGMGVHWRNTQSCKPINGECFDSEIDYHLSSPIKDYFLGWRMNDQSGLDHRVYAFKRDFEEGQHPRDNVINEVNTRGLGYALGTDVMKHGAPLVIAFEGAVATKTLAATGEKKRGGTFSVSIGIKFDIKKSSK